MGLIGLPENAGRIVDANIASRRLDFEDSPTSALFDRTPEQRERRAQLVGGFSDEAKRSMGAEVVRQWVDRLMYRDFILEVARLVKERVADTAQYQYAEGVPGASSAFNDITAELDALNEELPPPTIESMEHSSV
jgi:hypothetical protein